MIKKPTISKPTMSKPDSKDKGYHHLHVHIPEAIHKCMRFERARDGIGFREIVIQALIDRYKNEL